MTSATVRFTLSRFLRHSGQRQRGHREPSGSPVRRSHCGQASVGSGPRTGTGGRMASHTCRRSSTWSTRKVRRAVAATAHPPMPIDTRPSSSSRVKATKPPMTYTSSIAQGRRRSARRNSGPSSRARVPARTWNRTYETAPSQSSGMTMEKAATSSASAGMWSEIRARGPLTRRLSRVPAGEVDVDDGKGIGQQPAEQPGQRERAGAWSRVGRVGRARRRTGSSGRAQRSPSGGRVWTCAQS